MQAWLLALLAASAAAAVLHLDMPVDVALVNLPAIDPAAVSRALEGLRGDLHISIAKGPMSMSMRYHTRSHVVDTSSLSPSLLGNGDLLVEWISSTLHVADDAFTIVFIDLPDHSGFASSTECCSSVWVASLFRVILVNVGLGPHRNCEYGSLIEPGFVLPASQLPANPSQIDSLTYVQLANLCHRAAMHIIAPSLHNMHPAREWTEKVAVVLMDLDAKSASSKMPPWVDEFISALSSIDAQLSVRAVEHPMPCIYCEQAVALAAPLTQKGVNASVLWKLLRPEVAGPEEFVIVLLMSSSRTFGSWSPPSTPSSDFDFRDGSLLLGSASPYREKEFSCRGRLLPATMASKYLARRALAATLRGVFAVSPTNLRWSTAKHGFVSDYVYSIGHTPFGPFSTSLRASKAIVDAVWRNPVIAHLTETFSMLTESKAKRNGEHEWLEQGDKALHRAMVLIGLFDYNHAIVYARAARSYATMLRDEEKTLMEAVLVCPDDDGGLAQAALLASVLAACLVAVAYDTWISRRPSRPSLVGGMSFAGVRRGVGGSIAAGEKKTL